MKYRIGSFFSNELAHEDILNGLYAAGDCSGGFFAHNYPEYIVGVAVGRTLTEGYLLGAELAE